MVRDGGGPPWLQVAGGSERWFGLLVGGGLGKEVDHENAGEDEGNADDGGEVWLLVKEDEADDGEEDDAESGPHGVGDPERDAFEDEREEVKGAAVSGENPECGEWAREVAGDWEKRAGGNFGKDREGEQQVSVGHGGGRMAWCCLVGESGVV